MKKSAHPNETPKYLTPEGLANLKKELESLKTTGRTEMANRLKHAISFGDLSENAAYHEAKEAQGFLEGRIMELERTIRAAKVISPDRQKDFVGLGSRVKLLLDDEEMEFEIVGPQEANPMAGRISGESPLGREILGKKKGEQGKVQIGQAETKYKILAVN